MEGSLNPADSRVFDLSIRTFPKDLSAKGSFFEMSFSCVSEGCNFAVGSWILCFPLLMEKHSDSLPS